jgi:hypothetical protein
MFCLSSKLSMQLLTIVCVCVCMYVCVYVCTERIGTQAKLISVSQGVFHCQGPGQSIASENIRRRNGASVISSALYSLNRNHQIVAHRFRLAVMPCLFSRSSSVTIQLSLSSLAWWHWRSLVVTLIESQEALFPEIDLDDSDVIEMVKRHIGNTDDDQKQKVDVSGQAGNDDPEFLAEIYPDCDDKLSTFVFFGCHALLLQYFSNAFIV